MAWWFTPALMFGISYYVKTKVGKAKYRWLKMTEEDVRKLPVVVAIGKSEGGDKLPELELGWSWKPIRLTYAVSPFSPPSDVEIYVMTKTLAVPPKPAAANSHATAEDLGMLFPIAGVEDLGRRPHGGHRRHGWGRRPGWGWGPGPWWGPEPVYVEQLPVLVQAEEWIVEWTAKDGKKMSMSRTSEVEARRLATALASAGLKPTLTRRVGGVSQAVAGMDEIGEAAEKAISRLRDELAATGCCVVTINADAIRKGDFIVTAEEGKGRLAVVEQVHMPTGRPSSFDIRELHPDKGHSSRVSVESVCCAFGVRGS